MFYDYMDIFKKGFRIKDYIGIFEKVGFKAKF